MSHSAPPAQHAQFNQRKSGYFGELGTGGNARIKFIQTALSYDELDKITLIQNIPGSERWDVRDLFQRDVDVDRVTKHILPYLKDKQRVKFFNPLTLVLLPLSVDHAEVEKQLRAATVSEVEELGHQYELLEVSGFFRFKAHQTFAEYSSVEWNDRRVRVVAIDGQHRLSAMKRWKAEGGASDLMQWQIPVILLGIVKADPAAESASVLEVVRKTFVYINSRAEAVNRARRLLLEDESVNALCVQELIQASHENDVLSIDARDNSLLPLVFFEWRGETRDGRPNPSPAAVISTEEVLGWFREYLLGPDGDDKQVLRLELADLIPPLTSSDHKQIASHEDARRIRMRFREIVYPGVSVLLRSFTPFADYVREVRRLEREALEGSDLAKHAFSKLRFGSSHAEDDILEGVRLKFDEIVDDLVALKQRILPELINLDIGMRGIVAAFDLLKTFRDDRNDETIGWAAYADWFVDHINAVYESGWFGSYGALEDDAKRLLTHIVFDPSGSIINYKFADAGGGFGSVIALLVLQAADEGDALEDGWAEYSESLRVPLRRGYRKLIRAELRDRFTGTMPEFIARVNGLADAEVERHLDHLAEYLGLERL
jgi:hypothetical protein